MRFVSLATPAGPRAGLLRDGRLHPLDASLLSMVAAGLPAEPEPPPGEGMAVDEVELLPPIERPGKIICMGLNYRAHAEEQGKEAPETPTIFAKFANALSAPGATVELPRFSSKVDYEAEVAFVIGDRCKDLAVEAAMEHVAGYTLFNDLSARDLQFKTPQWMPGKVFDGAAPCGPALVTPDEAGPHDAIEIELRSTARSCGQLHRRPRAFDPRARGYLSMLMTLEPATSSPQAPRRVWAAFANPGSG